MLGIFNRFGIRDESQPPVVNGGPGSGPQGGVNQSLAEYHGDRAQFHFKAADKIASGQRATITAGMTGKGFTANEGATVDDDPVGTAERAVVEAELGVQIKAADAARAEAQKRTEAAFKLKPLTPAARKAHQTAAIAHGDAAAAYKAMGGGKSGNDLDKRAKALRLGKEHQTMTEKHTQLAAGDSMTKSTLNRSESVVTNGGPGSHQTFTNPGNSTGGFKTGSRVMVNTYSAKKMEDTASGCKAGEKANDAQSHTDAAHAHREMAAKIPSGGYDDAGSDERRRHQDAANAHEQAAKAHGLPDRGWFGPPNLGGPENASGKATAASKFANMRPK